MLEFLVGADDVILFIWIGRKNISHDPIKAFRLFDFQKAFAVRGIADHDSSSRRDGKLRNILYFGSNVGGNSRLFRVCHGQFYRLRVDVIAVCPDLGIPV